MPRKRGPARINGPYKTGDRWTFILISDGKKTTCHAPTEEEAERLIEELKPTLQAPPERTVMQAVEQYKEHMKVKGNRPGAVKSTGFALSRFLQPDDRPLADVTAKWCARRYFGSPGRDGKPAGGLVQELASDTHRNYLAETRTFFNWCREKPRCWLNKNPLAEVKGIGKRNPGGKGKKQLRLNEDAVWLAKALELADQGERGPVAALLTREGVDASAIVTLRVRDVDAKGAILWVGEEQAKTENRRRQINVPAWLRPYLLALCEGASPMAYLFRTTKGKSGHPWRDWPREWVQRICVEAGVCDSAGVPLTHAHGMRGLAGTLAALGGAEEAFERARQRLGHSHKSTTLDSYAADEAVSEVREQARLRVINGDLK